ncbi:MAG: hypothetical protein ACJAYG_000431 [Oceanicoccus sp.]|jgi:hypothetical protein
MYWNDRTASFMRGFIRHFVGNSINNAGLSTTVLLLTLITSIASAQTLIAEQGKLEKYQQQLLNLQQQQQQLSTQLQQTDTELKPLLGQNSPEQEKLNAAQEARAQAKANLEAEPSNTNKSKLKNNEFKYALAERKFKKANAKQFQLQETSLQLNTQLVELTDNIKKLQQQNVQQSKIVEQTRADELSTQQAQLMENQRLKAVAAEAEVTRLKAQLAAQEQQQKQQQLQRLQAEAAAKAETTRKAKVAADAALTQNTAPAQATTTASAINALTASVPYVKAAPDAISAADTNPAKPTATSVVTADIINNKIRFLATVSDIQAEQQRIATILATTDTKKTSRYNKILNVKRVSTDGALSKSVSHRIRPKGHNIYQGEALLKGGNTLFTVGFSRWRHKVLSINEAGSKYQVIYDGSDTQDIKIHYYLSSMAK